MTQFAVTIDTEADNLWARQRGPLSFENIRALPRLQKLCDRHGIVPTYLVTWAVASDAESRDILQSLLAQGRCEIGAHLHAWSTPPYEPVTEDDDKHHPYLYEYAREVQEEKLAGLTRLLSDSFGEHPLTYRAGRWGADAASVKLLEEMGYLVDTSVSPLVTWRYTLGAPGGRGGPCFLWAPTDVYRPSYEDIGKRGDSQLVEVPVTIAFVKPIGPRLQHLYKLLTHKRTLPRRLVRRALRMLGVCRVVWLHPALANGAEMMRLSERRITGGAKSLNMMFHSSELVAGLNPLVRDEVEERRVWEAMEDVFAFVTKEPRVRPVPLSAFAEAPSQ